MIVVITGTKFFRGVRIINHGKVFKDKFFAILVCLSTITLAYTKNLNNQGYKEGTTLQGKQRIIHFPKDRSLGNLLIQDENIKKTNPEVFLLDRG